MPPKKKAKAKNSKVINKKVAAKKKPAAKKVTRKPTKKAVAPKVKMKSSSGLPGLVIAIAVLWFIFAIADLGLGISFLVEAGSEEARLVNSLFGLSFELLGILALVFMVLYLIAGIGLLKRKQWGRILGIVLAGLGIITNFSAAILPILILLINLGVLVYLITSPEVKSFS